MTCNIKFHNTEQEPITTLQSLSLSLIPPFNQFTLHSVIHTDKQPAKSPTLTLVSSLPNPPPPPQVPPSPGGGPLP